jgi:hypothetical protein
MIGLPRTRSIRLGEALSVQGSHAWRGDSAVFDEDNLVSHARPGAADGAGWPSRPACHRCSTSMSGSPASGSSPVLITLAERTPLLPGITDRAYIDIDSFVASGVREGQAGRVVRPHEARGQEHPAPRALAAAGDYQHRQSGTCAGRGAAAGRTRGKGRWPYVEQAADVSYPPPKPGFPGADCWCSGRCCNRHS